MTKRILLGLALSFLIAGVVSADAVPTGIGPSSNAPWLVTVVNNTSSNISSGYIVVWDINSSDFVTNGYRYVKTSAIADDIWTAGVVYNDVCPAGGQCDIVVYGPADVLCYDSSDAIAISTTVGQSASGAGLCGDFTPAANKRSLGVSMETGPGSDNQLMKIFVNTLSAPAEQ